MAQTAKRTWGICWWSIDKNLKRGGIHWIP